VTTWALPASWGRALAPAVTLVAGLVILVAGLLGHSQSPTVTNVHTTWGTVLGYEVVPQHGAAPVYYAVVWYHPPMSTAAPVLFTDPNATATTPVIGSRVRVDYQPKNPTNAHVISELYDWVPWVVIGIGGVMILYGGFGVVGWARGRRRGGNVGTSGALWPRGGESP
jgi:hypothetical protein